MPSIIINSNLEELKVLISELETIIQKIEAFQLVLKVEEPISEPS